MNSGAGQGSASTADIIFSRFQSYRVVLTLSLCVQMRTQYTGCSLKYKHINAFYHKSKLSILKGFFSFVCDLKKGVLVYVNTRQSCEVWMIDSNHHRHLLILIFYNSLLKKRTLTIIAFVVQKQWTNFHH